MDIPKEQSNVGPSSLNFSDKERAIIRRVMKEYGLSKPNALTPTTLKAQPDSPIASAINTAKNTSVADDWNYSIPTLSHPIDGYTRTTYSSRAPGSQLLFEPRTPVSNGVKTTRRITREPGSPLLFETRVPVPNGVKTTRGITRAPGSPLLFEPRTPKKMQKPTIESLHKAMEGRGISIPAVAKKITPDVPRPHIPEVSMGNTLTSASKWNWIKGLRMFGKSVGVPIGGLAMATLTLGGLASLGPKGQMMPSNLARQSRNTPNKGNNMRM